MLFRIESKTSLCVYLVSDYPNKYELVSFEDDEKEDLIKKLISKEISKIVHDEYIYTHTSFGHI